MSKANRLNLSLRSFYREVAASSRQSGGADISSGAGSRILYRGSQHRAISSRILRSSAWRSSSCSGSINSISNFSFLLGDLNITNSYGRNRQGVYRSYRSSNALLMADKKRDYYEALGVSKGAGKDELKKKYFELAKKYHPDVNKGNKEYEDKFREISEAYEVLSDDTKKQQYDMFGHQDGQQGGGGRNPFEGFGGFGGFGGFQGGQGGQQMNIDPEELFSMFGFNVGIRKGANAAATVELSFLEAANGCEREIKYDYTVKNRENPRARGTKKSQSLKFKIPAGVIDGMALRVEGKGGEGPPGTPNGDLVVTIVVKEDPFFKREGTDIHIDVPITLSQAILGCTVDVLTLDGIVELKIPPGAQPGARLMMRSKGMRFVSDNMRRGHQYCHIKIKIPTAVSLSEHQKTLIQQFDDEEEKKKGSEAAGNNSFNTFNFESAVKRVNEFNKTKK